MEAPIKPCPAEHCTGQIYVGQFDSTIRVPAQDSDGFPVIEPDGTLVTMVLKLPKHVSPFVSQFRPGFPETEEERVNRVVYWREHPFPTVNYRGDES